MAYRSSMAIYAAPRLSTSTYYRLVYYYSHPTKDTGRILAVSLIPYLYSVVYTLGEPTHGEHLNVVVPGTLSLRLRLGRRVGFTVRDQDHHLGHHLEQPAVCPIKQGKIGVRLHNS